MTLDLTKITVQIAEMVEGIKNENRNRNLHLQSAVTRLKDGNLNLDDLKRKILTAKTHWSFAGVFEPLNTHHTPALLPSEYTVLATDGSHINLDRHRSARCYLINIGTVKLHYGKKPAADLDSIPRLYAGEADLVIQDPSNVHRRQHIEGALLDAKRSGDEAFKLAALATEDREDICPVLVLMDGSLVMFGLESFPDFVIQHLLVHGLIPALDRLQDVSTKKSLALASYISYPGSSDVVNSLRISLCPYPNAECDRYCSEGNSACDLLADVNDRMIFSEYLAAGERSALFINRSEIVTRYQDHRVYFFYLRVEDEIARVEIPAWVALNSDLVELTHVLVLDQCRRGQGYPVALSEAHEKAVVNGADREEFWGLVEEALLDEKLTVYSSTKSRSKRTRWI